LHCSGAQPIRVDRVDVHPVELEPLELRAQREEVVHVAQEDVRRILDDDPLRPIDAAVARMRAARTAIDDAGGDTLLVGRAENFIVGRPDLADTIVRLRAYSDAGADCLYAPGVRTREEITAIVAAVAPKPFNLLVGSTSDFTMQDIAAMGVRRVSVGGGLARAAWGGFLRAARALAGDGRFDGFAEATPGNELNAFFRGSGAPEGSR